MGVVIGVDPHKRSNTALVLDANEHVLDRRRFTDDKAGYRELKTWARTWKGRTWAVEGARGVGLSLAQRLAVEGEPVLNVPAKMSAQVRVFGGGSGRKTDDTDAHAVAGLRSRTLQTVRPDDHVTVVKLLTDRREQLVEQRIAHRQPAPRPGHGAGPGRRCTAADQHEGQGAAVLGPAAR